MCTGRTPAKPEGSSFQSSFLVYAIRDMTPGMTTRPRDRHRMGRVYTPEPMNWDLACITGHRLHRSKPECSSFGPCRKEMEKPQG